MCLIALTGPKSTFWTVLSIVFFVLVPIGYVWFDKLSENGNRLLYIDKAQGRIRQVVKESSRTCRKGAFRELHVYEGNPPGQGGWVYQAHLVCDAGSTFLFAMYSEDQTAQLATEIANWLGVALSWSRNVSLGTVLDKETLFPD